MLDHQRLVSFDLNIISSGASGKARHQYFNLTNAERITGTETE